MAEELTTDLSLGIEDGYMLFAGWMGPKGRPTRRHAVREPAEGEAVFDEEASLVTYCGRVVPDDAHLEAMRTHQAHDMNLFDCCVRCNVTRRLLATTGTREAMFNCYPTDCMLCHERLLDPGRWGSGSTWFEDVEHVPIYQPKMTHVLAVSWRTHRPADPWTRWHVTDGRDTRVSVLLQARRPPLTLCGRPFNMQESRHEVMRRSQFLVRLDAHCQLCQERAV